MRPTLLHSFYALCGIFAMMVAALTGMYIYSSYFERSWLWYGNLPLPVGTGKYHAGDVVPTTVLRCSALDRPREYHSSHAIKCDDGSTFTLPTVDITADVGCVVVESKINISPAVAAPTQCYFFGASTVRGLMVDHIVDWKTRKFNAVPK